MAFQITTATKKIMKMDKRIRAVQGGTAGSKTVSILLYLIHLAQSDKNPKLTSVVSESLPHLKKGAMRDFLAIMQQHGYYQEDKWNRSDFTYNFETGSKIEFFSADQPAKVRGPRRDRLFINEANNIPFETFEQLEIRTNDFVYMDWNPTNEFWFYTDVKGNRSDIDHIILNYKDNEALNPAIIASIEQRKNRKGWWQVYGLGQLGEVEGKIYRDWQIIDEVPHEARLEKFGLDFGYTTDPSAIVAVYRLNQGLILDEILYQKGLSNKQIADILSNQDKAVVIADSAEPKSIDEIHSFGIPIIPCKKGKDSVRSGIALVQDQRISVTKRSVNIIHEYRNYLWLADKNGKLVSPNEPEKGFDHCCFTKDVIIEIPVGYILFKKYSGKKDVYEFMGSKVTADHPYLTQRGFVTLDRLRYSDRIVLWKNKLLTELPLDDTQNPVAVSFGTILNLLRRNVSAIKQNGFIGIYGKNIMVKRQKVFISTTKTTIHLIIVWIISNVYHLPNTIRNTIKKCYQSGKRISKTPLRKLVSGVKLKKGKNSVKDKVLKMLHISQDTKLQEIATNVEKNMLQKQNTENSATIIAKLKHCGQEDVYATTTTNGFFVANGVVVSNCDAIRYAITAIPKLYSSETGENKEKRIFNEMIKRKKKLTKEKRRLFT